MDIGAKIRKLRKTNGLTLEELASRSELSKGFLSQIERNLASPSIATLSDILNVLGTSLAEFFKEESDEKIVFTKDDFFWDEKLDHTICWIVPNAQKNQMEPILLKLPVHGKSMEIENHEGEEFGFVLKGTIRLKLENGPSFLVSKGETFYLDGSRSHTLYNVGKTLAEVLWISNPPVF